MHQAITRRTSVHASEPYLFIRRFPRMLFSQNRANKRKPCHVNLTFSVHEDIITLKTNIYHLRFQGGRTICLESKE